MEKSQCYIGTPNGVVLCVDKIGTCRIDGRAYHAYSNEATNITNMSELLFELEGFYNSICFPFPSVNERTFQDKKPSVRLGKGRVKVMSDEELLSKHGYLGTFIIRVQHRQHSSWQGRITWMDKNKTLYFRSAWEMVKLIASALATVNSEESLSEKDWPEDTENIGDMEDNL